MAAQMPKEVLEKICSYLEIQDVVNCTSVCVQWKNVLDSSNVWKELCEQHFSDIYEDSYQKANLTWQELAKSLASWKDIGNTREQIKIIDDIHRFIALKDDVVCIILKDSDTVIHYDVKNMKEISRISYELPFEGYQENDNFVVLDYNLNDTLIIRIIPKNIPNEFKEFSAEFYVPFHKGWLLKDNEVFYTNKNFDNDTLLSKYTIEINEKVIYEHTILATSSTNIGILEDIKYINDKLHLFQFINNKFEIISVDDGFNKLYEINNESNDAIFTDIKNYGFHWDSHMFGWLAPFLKYKDGIIKAAVSYGKYVIFCCKDIAVNFSIKIYKDPFINNRSELYDALPVKVVDLERYSDHIKVTQQAAIFEMDVVEMKIGHILLLNLHSKLFIIYLFR